MNVSNLAFLVFCLFLTTFSTLSLLPSASLYSVFLRICPLPLWKMIRALAMWNAALPFFFFLNCHIFHNRFSLSLSAIHFFRTISCNITIYEARVLCFYRV